MLYVQYMARCMWTQLNRYVTAEQTISKPQTGMPLLTADTLLRRLSKRFCSYTLSAKRLLQMLDDKAWLSVDFLDRSKNLEIIDLTKTMKIMFQTKCPNRNFHLSYFKLKTEFHLASSTSKCTGSQSYYCN